VANLKQEINGLVDTSNQTEQMDSIKQVWDSERQRLNETIERYTQQLSTEQADHQQLKQKIELLEDQAKRGDKLDSEKQQLEEQVQQLQRNYDEQLQARGRYLDDVRTAVESQKKTQNELRRLLEAKEKVDRELELARADLTKVESTLSSLRSSSTNMDDWIKEKQQQTKDMDTLRSEIERLEAQNTMLSKQKESAELAVTAAAKGGESQGDETALIQRLKADNKKLAQDHDSLKESHKQMETECLKLMDEVEKLHSEGLILPTTTDASLTPEESVAQLERQLADAKRQMEKLSLQHSSEVQRIKEQQEEANRKHQREISSLNRDVTELEGIIEAKIFKEDDLEKALESERKTASRLRDDIMELRAEQSAAKKRNDPSTCHGTISNSSSSSGTSTLGPMTDDGPYCEICELAGHDLMSCKAVLDGSSKDTLERPVKYKALSHSHTEPLYSPPVFSPSSVKTVMNMVSIIQTPAQIKTKPSRTNPFPPSPPLD
jgi:chromosome segregation ATPase